MQDERLPESGEEPAADEQDRIDAEAEEAEFEAEAREQLVEGGADPGDFFPSVPHPF
ncbi:MAG: hypothetical protein J7480_02550 [Microbacteriaceae bacterium]|nr:hypothetical protein [Microbacteriaceae bacterium]